VNLPANAFQESRIPVTILTGFLGAGKTTLLNRILTAPHSQRVAVIVNEFGEVGIDHHLLISSDEEIFQMNNGCICCTVRGDLIRVLFQLLEQKTKFDSLLIETTGLADPAPLVQTLLIDEKIRTQFRLDSIVTVVDAKHISLHIDERAEAQEQIACADTILLNKTDLATPEDLDLLEAKIRSLNGMARIFRTRNADVELATLFNSGGFNLNQRQNFEPKLLGSDHRHHNPFSTVSLVEPGELDGRKLSYWFRSVLDSLGPDILRMKGILNLQGDSHQFVFHGVHAIFEGRPGRPWNPDEQRLNRLVFIGKNLDSQALSEGFSECLAVTNGGSPSASSHASWQTRDVSHFTIDQIAYWVRQVFNFPPDTPVMVNEVPCVKPNCPPVETAIMVFLQGEPPRLFKIQKTLHEISFDNVYDLIENPLPCC
jgi:G3E family GTPase